ncbi:MAG: 3-isopropylmalate dehydratase small subunit [Rhizobiaceae bacterium MnEN-MB40S]|nr:MAG: 3-isopropylmalate dehydratase small subunit [Rhizobiaceae bacterium MnEN-MB40S]
MTPFTAITSAAVRLPLSNVDTDQLLPARFMSQPRSEGYGDFLLHDLSRDDDGDLRPDFALNAPEAKGAQVLVARRNFGGGSSREGAVYALVDHGFRCVIAPSFGDIFSNNAANNGLLTAQAAEDDVEFLLTTEGDVSVDLRDCTIHAAGRRIAFDINPVKREKLLNGWEDVDLTLSRKAKIDAFSDRDRHRRPWLVPTQR